MVNTLSRHMIYANRLIARSPELSGEGRHVDQATFLNIGLVFANTLVAAIKSQFQQLGARDVHARSPVHVHVKWGHGCRWFTV
jgi:hypothetical protein